MTLFDYLSSAIQKLSDENIPTAKLDAELLLADMLDVDRSWVQTHPEHKLQGQALRKLDEQVKRRAEHEPLAYIRGKSEFYGYEFFVNNHTLQPRPETETLVVLVTKQVLGKQKLKAKSSKLNIVDVGTGSGCIAITLKRLLPQAKVYGTDVDKKCLELAQKNAQNQQIDVDFFEGDLLNAVSNHISKIDIIAANLPYVPNDFQINRAASHEPKHAIYGGVDGLKLYRKLFLQVSKLFSTPQLIVTESLPTQHEKLAEIAKKYTYELLETQDFIQVFSAR